MNPNRILPSLLRAAAGIFAASLMTAGLYAQVLAAPVVPNRITQPIDNSFRVTLHGMVSPLANAANDRGAAPASMQVDRIHMVLKRSASQEAALRSLIQAQNTPGSAEYHKWLTPAEFGQQFGPSSQDVAKIQSWLESEGFSGVKVNPGALTVEFNGTASQFSHAFGAEFHRYALNGKTYDAVANNPQIPAALAPVVQGFVALNNFPLHKYSRLLGKATYDPQTHKATADWAYPQGGGVANVVSPQDFGVEYNLPNKSLNPNYTGATQYTGAGQTIAIVNEANINVSLVNSYRSLFGLPANPPHVIIVGNDPGIDGINNPGGPNGASIEAYLDVEEAGAVAPDATIDLVIAGDTASENGLILAAEHAVYSDVAPVISLSFGLCEQQLGPSNQFINQLWEQAAAEGITVMVSTGDDGSAGCDSSSAQYATGGLAVSGLASTPYDVAVGGTDFYYSDYQSASQLQTQLGTYWNLTGTDTPQASILQHIPEQAWNDSQFGADALNYYQLVGSTTVAGGSGGASSCVTGTTNTTTGAYSTCSGGYAKPTWQSGVGVPADKVRDIPDVSLFAADGTNYSFYPICAQDGDCQTPASGSPAQITGVGGTSAAAPAFAGIMALVNEQYGPQGQADNVLYALAAQDPTAFNDVTFGTNSVPCEYSPTLSPNCISAGSKAITVTSSSGVSIQEGQLGTGTTPSYNATAGYDLATGLGSVNAANLIADWGNVKFATSTVTLTSPTAGASITHGSAVNFTGTVAGTSGTTPTGDVVIQTSSTAPGQQSQSYFTLSSGAFNGTLNALPGGTYDVWAQYSGDTKNAAATSSPVQITVSPESSTLLYQAFTYNSSGSASSVAGQSIPYGTQVLFDATPYGSSYYSTCVNVSTKPSTCQPQTPATGTVTFTDGSTTLSTAVVDSEGTAEYVTPALTVGSHSITAAYSGDNSYSAPTTNPTIAVTVTKATPAILVTAPTNGGNTGQNFVLTVLVASNGIGTAPTGTLTVSGAPSGTTASATLGSTADPTYGNTSAVANIVIPGTAAAGTYNLTISYGGDSNYNSSSTTYSFTEGSAAQGAASSITATASPTAPSTTTPITAKATVTGQSGKPTPTGTVYFIAGLLNPQTQAQISEYALAAVKLGQGSGDSVTVSTSFSSSGLVQGDNYLTVFYSGDSNYASSSTVLNLSNPMSDFSMVAQNPLVPINSASGSVTDTVNLTAVNGFSGTVALTCTAPAGLSCTLDQSSVTLNSTTTTTTGPISELRKLMLFGSGGGMALGCLFLIGVPARKRKWRTMIGMVLVFAVLSFGMLGCGGGSSGSGGGFGGGSGGGSGSGGGTTVSSSSNGGSSSSNGGNVTVPVKATITGNGSVAAGSYQVVVTGSASSTSQVHTITITTVVQ